MSELRVLAVDDEPPALDELAYLLRADPRVASVHTAGDATGALRLLRDLDIDAVFLDIRMPGLDGMELARVLTRFAKPPAVVFVTAYEERAVEAFELGVVAYVRKPVLAERWGDAGFVRIHRSYLVQLRLITELRLAGGAYVVVIDGRELPVSRRHTRDLKDRLVRAAKQNWNR